MWLLQASDKLQEETSEKKNALEEYMYDLRGKMYDSLAAYVREQDRENLSSRLNELEDWLYDEVRGGEGADKCMILAARLMTGTPELCNKSGQATGVRFAILSVCIRWA